MPLTQLTFVTIAAVLAGAVNSIAGGGTLLTFPVLVASGVPPINANATNTVALWPGALGSMWGYRKELAGARLWALVFTVPSLLGGALGAWLLLMTTAERFESLVPWLVLSGTVLFTAQRPLVRWFTRHAVAHPVSDEERLSRRPPTAFLGYQFLVAIYGGYFGAGVGILLLAALGFMGLNNIHRMNGLKNWGALCMNVVASGIFAFTHLVHWPVALAMIVGATGGGYAGSRLAQRVPQSFVRTAISVIGFSTFVYFVLR